MSFDNTLAPPDIDDIVDMFNDYSNKPYEDSGDESDNGCAEVFSEDELEPVEPMVLLNHRTKKMAWEGRSRLGAVLAVLNSISAQGLDLPLFLDALFYGDKLFKSGTNPQDVLVARKVVGLLVLLSVKRHYSHARVTGPGPVVRLTTM
ncbi:hypothetical protein EV361DRAFT_992751 [Lentinula raphanica]|nr:hypothetical protein EV361DRAFT_992751 [Lentinula raphanica]